MYVPAVHPCEFESVELSALVVENTQVAFGHQAELSVGYTQFQAGTIVQKFKGNVISSVGMIMPVDAALCSNILPA